MTASLDLVAAAAGRWRGERTPLVIGICGAQGSGKSTLARQLARRLEGEGATAAVLSLDDLYLDKSARARLARDLHPLFAVRGVPGTHDIALGERVMDGLAAGAATRLPRFDKARDAPYPAADWPEVTAPQVVILEGWCVGARPQDDAQLSQPVNDLERLHDAGGVWRRAVNDALKSRYQALFGRIDRLVLLAAPDFGVVRTWRTQQEHGLRHRLRREGRDGRAMSDREIAGFIRYYERLTCHILAEMPGRADLTLRLGPGRKLVTDT